MGAQNSGQNQITPKQILGNLGHVEWIHETAKEIRGESHSIKLFGFFNPLRSISICVITDNELEWIYAQTEQSLLSSAAFDAKSVCLMLFCEGCSPSPLISEICKKNNIGLAKTDVASDQVLDYLQSQIPRCIAMRGVKHGVFLAVMNVGVLITGASGVGKSEVAMDLVQRGHQLIADDAVDIYKSEQVHLIGECPDPLKGYIEIRGLGIINIFKMFGPASVLDSYKLQLVIDLIDATNSEIQKVDRLEPSLKDWEMLGIKVPCLTMLVAPGRNLSVLVEAAVRDHLLRMSGVDSAAEFSAAHQQFIGNRSAT